MLTLDDIISATSGRLLHGTLNKNITSVSIDSRTISPRSLYIAIQGEHHDGHDFVEEAFKKKAAAVVVSQFQKSFSGPTLLVKDTTKALGDIAKYYRKKFSIPVIAVTGSCGKTTTKELISKVLSTQYHVHKTEKNLNNQFGLPLSILKLKKKHDIAVFEVGVNQKGDMDHLGSILQPNMVIFTNIGASHLAGLGSLTGVFQEKSKLIKYMRPKGCLIYNADDATLHYNLKHKKALRFGLQRKVLYQAKKRVMGATKQTFEVRGKSFCIKGLGRHHVLNALSAILCGSHFKVSYNNIYNTISRDKGSFQRGYGQRFGGIQVLDDTYNANPLSFAASLDALYQLKGKGRKIVVGADMLELGKDAVKFHQDIARQIKALKLDAVFSLGTLAKHFSNNMPASIHAVHAKNHHTLHKALQSYLQKGDCILVKGSRSMAMDQTVLFLRQRFS